MKTVGKTDHEINTADPLVAIKASYQSLSPANKRIADYVLKNPTETTELSITALAEKCGVGEATVIRFCRCLKFNGFQELKLSIARNLVSPVSHIEHHIEISDDFPTIVEKITQRSSTVFAKTTSILDLDDLQQAIDILANSQKRLLCGIGFSGLSAATANYQFMRLGLDCEYHRDLHFSNMRASSLGPGDVLLCFSHSGSTKDMVKCTQIAKDAKAKTIVVTSFPRSPITRNADLVLCTSSQEHSIFGGTFAVRLSQSFIIYLLYVGLALSLDAEGLEASLKTAAAVSDEFF